ncbi:MAG: hypothetical protein K0A89_06650 [ANME-2 cluster archaeon]|nr:hypothetical protein [ANME-2 cluster archaeon]
MQDNYSIYNVDLNTSHFTPFALRNASSLKINEKNIENWMATEPKLLFSNPDSVMIIAQEISGEVMADLLAVDSQGNLIIIEIKRDWSDRNTVGQILDYAALLASWEYEDFNDRWKKYKGVNAGDLFEEFKNFSENPDFRDDEFLEQRRLFILASSVDESMKRIIKWLSELYNVPIDYVPFQFYENNGQVFLQISKIDIQPIAPKWGWSGDWFFNTNETYGKGAYQKMFDQSVIAVHGYPNTQEYLNRPEPGGRVFAYINGRGVAAVGILGERDAFSSGSVFGKENEQEFNRHVTWETIVQPEKAVRPAESSQWGYNLPIRSTLCRMYHKSIAQKIADELKRRESENK